MGCNSSQVHVESPTQPSPAAEIQSEMNLAESMLEPHLQSSAPIIMKLPTNQKIQKIPHRQWCFLFGQTALERKIVSFDTNNLQFSTVSSKFKIPEPPVLKYHPIQTIYQESQQLFSSSLFSKNSRPPYNFMLAIWLDSKRIFLCGGINFDFDFVSNESFIYDTQAIQLSLSGVKSMKLGNNLMGSKFEKVSFMHNKRYSQMGVVYSVGLLKYVYVFGGRGVNNELLKDCEKFSVTENRWVKISPMNIARSTGFAFVYRERIYVCGGYSSEPKRTKKIEVYHPDKDYWEILDIKMHRGLETGSLFSIRPNELLFIGGNLEYGAVNSVVEVNLKNETYISVDQMKYPRVLQKGCITDKNIIIFGGNMNDGLQVYNYNGKNDKEWVTNTTSSFTSHIKVEEMNSFSYSLETVEVEYNEELSEPEEQTDISDQRSLIFSHDSSPFILDINFTKQSITKKPVPMALRLRSHMGCMKIEPGKYFIAGGVSQFYEKPTRCCYVYDLVSNKAKEEAKMIASRYSFAICVYQNEVYVFGGRASEDDQPLYSCQKWSRSEDSWLIISSLVVRRHSAKAIPIKSKIYVVGGSDGVRQLDEIEVYDPKENSMVLVDIIIKLIENVQVVRRQDSVFIFGGQSEDKERLYRLQVVENKYKAEVEQEDQVQKEDYQPDESSRPKGQDPMDEAQKNLRQEEQQENQQPQHKDTNEQKEQIKLQANLQQSHCPQQPRTQQPQQSYNQQTNSEQQKIAKQHKFQEQVQKVGEVVEILATPQSKEKIDLDDIPVQKHGYKRSYDDLTAELTFFEAPCHTIFAASQPSACYFFSTDSLIYKWSGKRVEPFNPNNIQLLQNVDFQRVTFS